MQDIQKGPLQLCNLTNLTKDSKTVLGPQSFQTKLCTFAKQEYQAQMDLIKAEPLCIVYSYWDGAGHRREVKVKKGDTVSERDKRDWESAFLLLCLEGLSSCGLSGSPENEGGSVPLNSVATRDVSHGVSRRLIR